MKVLQVNVNLNTGSTGVMAEDIGREILAYNGQSHIAYGRNSMPSESKVFKIGNKVGQAIHLLKTRILDLHGLASEKATKELCKYITNEKFDIVHLHNIHGYYLHFEILMNRLKQEKIPVVWTFHDCWPFTGHCAHFEHVQCEKWKTECYSCPLKKKYPANFGPDRSTTNFRKKKEVFTGLKNLTIVPVSRWLGRLVAESFFADKNIHVIHNGVNVEVYQPTLNHRILDKYKLGKPYILGVSNIWTGRKGLADFIALRKILSNDIEIVLIGLNKQQIEKLPKGVIGIRRTENKNELVTLYSQAEVFVNPSRLESFGLVTVEAMACGTPAIVYNATASPELISSSTGHVVEVGDIDGLLDKINVVRSNTKKYYNCRDFVVNNFNRKVQNQKYIELYSTLLNKDLNER